MLKYAYSWTDNRIKYFANRLNQPPGHNAALIWHCTKLALQVPIFSAWMSRNIVAQASLAYHLIPGMTHSCSRILYRNGKNQYCDECCGTGILCCGSVSYCLVAFSFFLLSKVRCVFFSTVLGPMKLCVSFFLCQAFSVETSLQTHRLLLAGNDQWQNEQPNDHEDGILTNDHGCHHNNTRVSPARQSSFVICMPFCYH